MFGIFKKESFATAPFFAVRVKSDGYAGRPLLAVLEHDVFDRIGRLCETA